MRTGTALGEGCEGMNFLITGGRIITMDPDHPQAEAVSVRAGHIAAVGTLSQVLGTFGPGVTVETVNLCGGTLLPGFIDGHAHLSMMGGKLMGIDLKSLRSIGAIQEAVGRRVRALPAGCWIRGFGYNDFFLAERRHPTRDDLDAVSPAHPVILTRTCGHIAVVNSMALRVAGIENPTGDPPGGRYGRRADGRLDGVLYDQALQKLQDWGPSPEEMAQGLERASAAWARAGITTVHDAGGPWGYLKVLLDASLAGRVTQTVHAMIWNGLGVRQLEAFLPAELRTGFALGNVHIGAAKVMVDGSSSGPTAATREGYAVRPEDQGLLYQSFDELHDLLSRAHRQGFQVTTHAVGDRAIAMTIDVMERLDNPRRPRIEHCAMCPPDLIARMALNGITPVAQPAFLREFGDGYVQNYGWDRGSRMFPIKSWLRAGLKVVGSSDSPIADYRPLAGIATAMDRTTLGGAVLAPDERISLVEGLALYTVNGAWIGHQEQNRGKIAPGYRADLVAVDKDITGLDPERLAEASVMRTWIAGRTVWDGGLQH